MVKLVSILSYFTLSLVDEGRTRSAHSVAYEAEDGVLRDIQVDTVANGYTGTGYVTSYTNGVGSLTIPVIASSTALYDLDVAYEAPYGDRYTSVTLNGASNGKIYFPSSSTFTKTSGGPIHSKEGENELIFTNNWEGYMIDSISTTPLAPTLQKAVEKLMRSVTWIVNQERSQSEGAQCAGGSAWDGWSGPRWCDEGLVCAEINPFYSECRWP